MSLGLRDWLWRLDRIQEEMQKEIPDAQIVFSVSFSRMPDLFSEEDSQHKQREIETFPYGRVLCCEGRPIQVYRSGSETALLKFMVRTGASFPFVIAWIPWTDFWLHDEAPPQEEAFMSCT
jgi:hypothetical protein